MKTKKTPKPTHDNNIIDFQIEKRNYQKMLAKKEAIEMYQFLGLDPKDYVKDYSDEQW